MTMDKAREIQEAWNKAGSAPCRHGFADPLESEDGVDMGTNVCAICGSHAPGLHSLAAAASEK
jgi:hypothetical protein